MELSLLGRKKAQVDIGGEARVGRFMAEVERLELGVNGRFARGNVAMQWDDGILTSDDLERERAERLKQRAG